MNVVETLQAEHTDLTAKLGQMDERIKNERPGLVAQIAQINRALTALTKPASVPGTRKPMSEEGKAAIKAGLEKARAAKLAKSEPTPVAPQQTAAVSSEPNTGAKKAPSSDKGPVRA